MQLEPITWERMAEALARHLDGPLRTSAPPGGRVRVAIDGAPAADTGALAALVADALRLRGRPVLAVAADGFLRPASLRFEHGREDADSYLDEWYDVPALWREVFVPAEPDGSGRLLPDLWDPVTDRATRSPYAELPPGGVLIVHGPLLLRHWFPFDLSVHVGLSAGALARRTRESERWTLPAFARYESETEPTEAADVLVRADDPRHPAWSGLPPA
ncbi:uridine kinase [Streptomyces sp. NPDC002073]|uniref:uridine kinase n=1 Tax=Streptomyces sp. NBC_00239 TaxID=2903640 RepID=UPI002E2CC7A1|nr:uridine kinase [Streptomyces sp. NBC_00239]